MRGFFGMALLFVLLSGCRSLPIARGPSFALEPMPVDPQQSLLPVAIVDARPRWERHYYEGPLTFVPLENLTASPWDRLRLTLTQQLKPVPDSPCQATLLLQSFRVILNDEEKVKTEEEQQLAASFDESDPLQGVLGELLFLGCKELFVCARD